jgi:Ca-activated chloride channel homolog
MSTDKLKLLLIVVLLMASFSALFGDGFIVVDPYPRHRIFPPPRPRPRPLPIPPQPTPFPMEVKYHHVNIDIEGQVAATSVDQVFVNPTHHRLEGYYLFPIPANAVIKKFSMYVNGKELQAELLDARKARRIYEDIVRRQRDPALLEYVGRRLLKARIFPIEPRSEKRVKISYRQLLPKENHTIEYLYPLNTEKFSAKPLKDVTINVNVNSNEQIKSIYCPTHETDIIRKGKKKAIVSFEAKNTKPNTDFKLYYSTNNEKLGFSLLSYKEKKNQDGYFYLSLSPGYSSKDDEISEKDITFVIDVSGSMAGKKLKQAKKALLFCIENLNKGDRFEIIRFSTEAEALFTKLTNTNEGNLQQAREFIDELKAIGGTNIDDALSLALNMKTHSSKPYMIIFLTDGKPTIGVTEEKSLINKIKDHNSSGTRIFTFGIGNEINTHLLDKITELTRAYRTYITPKEDIEIKVSHFYSNVQSPILTDLQLDFGNHIRVSKTYPRNLPDLFRGSNITLLGRYKGDGDARIMLTGKIKGKEKQFLFKAVKGFKNAGRESKMNDFIPSLWAARRVGYLLDQIRLHGKDKELVDEVTELARTYGIITPYTSYLIVEDEQSNVRRHLIDQRDQTLAQVVERRSQFKRKVKKEYSSMKSKSGSGSVRASKELQQLNDAANVAQTRPGESRLNYRDREGKTQNIAAQLKNVQGRAVYYTGKFWVDSHIQKQKQDNQLTKRIQFASKDYFTLLTKEPLSAQFLALGKNIRFLLEGTLYEIYE